jgi:hypothetical protein
MQLISYNTYLKIDGLDYPYDIYLEIKNCMWFITNAFGQCFNRNCKWEKENISNPEFLLRCSFYSSVEAFDFFQNNYKIV